VPAALKTKEEVIQLLTAVFRKHGYTGATLSMLSEATGLVKASLYHYFPKGKQDMGLAVLEQVGAQFMREVIEPIDYNGDSHQQLKNMCQNLIGFYHDGRAACLLEVFSLGQAGELFHDIIASRIERLTEVITTLLQKAGFEDAEARERAIDAIVRVEGALVVARASANRWIFINTMKALPEQLLKP